MECFELLNHLQKEYAHKKNLINDFEDSGSLAEKATFRLLLEKKTKIEDILLMQDFEEEKLEYAKRTLCEDNLLYKRARKFGDEELLEKFHDRSLTRDKYVEAAKKFGVDLGIDDYNVASFCDDNANKEK